MQVLCIAAKTETNTDVHCPCCGQGYTLFYSRFDKAEQARAREQICTTLREQHDRSQPAHRLKAFNVPLWSGSPCASAAAALNGLTRTRQVRR